MSGISKILYVDAMFFLTEECDPYEGLAIHEAYGYRKSSDKDIFLTFIQRKVREPFFKKMYRTFFFKNKEIVTKGLLIPKGLLFSKNRMADNTSYKRFPLGAKVSVTWNDVVYLANVPLRESHTMCSEGTLFSVQKDRVILRAPTTWRMSPHPHKPHAEYATYLILPNGSITHMKSCTEKQ